MTAHVDYDWYSRQDPSTTPVTGWRGMTRYPEKYYSLQGKVVTGQDVAQGGQVPANYREWSEHTSGGPLEGVRSGTDNVKASVLVANNPGMNWPTRASWNFTAQLLLASSYGLSQVLYETAINRSFDTRTEDGSAEPIQKLFDPETIINLSAKALSAAYVDTGNWNQAILQYNSKPGYRDRVLTRWNNGNGDFKLLIINN